MILLWGIASEPPVRLAIAAAERAGLEHLVVHQRTAADDDIVWDVGAGMGSLRSGGTGVALEAVTGVYVRIMDPEALPEASNDPPDRARRARAFHDYLLGWADGAPPGCRVANPTAAMASNASKPYQAQLIRSVGFDVPETLVTDDPQAVRAFEAEVGPLVFKSTSSVRSIVRVLDAAARTRLARLGWVPVQFQRQERGTDIRVHVVGGRVLAASALSDAVDYRYAASEGKQVRLAVTDLPDAVAERCLRLSALLALPFCGIDLLRRRDDTWVCFEVNPSPGYSWYEATTGLPISDALVRWLAGRD